MESKVQHAGGRGASGRSVVWYRRVPGRRSVLLPMVAAAAALMVVGAPAAQSKGDEGPTTRVIVVGKDAKKAEEHAKKSHGDNIDTFDVANSAATDVTASELADLQGDRDVTVVPNLPIEVTAATFDGRSPAAVFPQTTGSSSLVATGVDGRGVGVAVLDTGIASLPDFGSRLVAGVDLSGEGNAFADSYGHGTFVAGLIAGNGASSGGQYKGEAPGANLVSVKVAGASGSTDLATVLSGLDWVMQNRGKYNIRVVNISLGMAPVLSTVNNPLDQAVERAWKDGIVVVTSAGNTGPFNGTITSPGDDPMVITAGAIDDNGTPQSADDTMATFSAAGPTLVDGWFKPDLVTSGRSVVSLRAPGSTIDTLFPTARVGAANFVGSGTSFSAAITSGAAAQIVQGRSNPKPDWVKGWLMAGAAPGPVGSPFVDGMGSLNVAGAMTSQPKLKQIAPTVATPLNTSVSLFITGAGSAWNGSNWNGSAWNGSAWNGSAWNGSAWNGSAWNGSAWNGSAWNGSAWNGYSWNGSAWNGSAWNGSAWNGSAWNSSGWNGSAWNGSAWNGSAWNGSAWNGSAWNGSAWNGSAWN